MAGMFEHVVELCVRVAAVYAAAGTLFAAAFVARGVNAMDPAACNAGIGFRLLIVPGVIVFWPLLLRRWVQAVRS